MKSTVSAPDRRRGVGRQLVLPRHEHGQTIERESVAGLHGHFTARLKSALARQVSPARDGAEIDHIELFRSRQSSADSRNFVLCPGNAYDRSPCGTGTAASWPDCRQDCKLRLEIWQQESIIGSMFEGSVEVNGDA